MHSLALQHTADVSQPLQITLTGKKNTIEKVLSGASDHLAITAESGSRGTVFLTLAGASCAIDIFVGQDADIAVICLQSGNNAKILQRSKIEAGASLRWHNVTVGENVTQDLVSTVQGDGAKSDIDWIFRLSGKNTQSISARNVFAARSGGGEITLKGVAEQKAHATCNGMIEITEAGRGTDTYLTEDVLMLDATAKVDAIPALEIRTNDVKASHSATVSRVTAEDLFYFQSRGIDPQSARVMFVHGFLGDLVAKIADANVRHTVQGAIGLL